MLKKAMPLISLTIAHGQTQEEARRRLEMAVREVSERFGRLGRVDWSADRNRVKMETAGAWLELWVDDRDVHATGDITGLGALMSGPLVSGLKQILQQAFRKQLP
jgi:Putative polyhydroxyalkanoic acid system protein (PHA_gran_rgn)